MCTVNVHNYAEKRNVFCPRSKKKCKFFQSTTQLKIQGLKLWIFMLVSKLKLMFMFGYTRIITRILGKLWKLKVPSLWSMATKSKKCKFFHNTKKNQGLELWIFMLVSKLKHMFMFRLLPITYENFRKTMKAESAKFVKSDHEKEEFVNKLLSFLKWKRLCSAILISNSMCE